MMKWRFLVALVVLTAACGRSAAESVVEAWRSATSPAYQFADPLLVSLNPTDSSCWVADTANNQVVHLAQDGTELWRGGGFYCAASVSVNSADGTCWVADTGNNQVVHLAQSGTELWRGGGFNQPNSVSVNSADGSCWVADTTNSQIVHLSVSGGQLWRSPGPPIPQFQSPLAVAANPTDGSCWISASNGLDGISQIIHVSAGGAELWRSEDLPTPEFYSPYSISVNPADSSCWVADTNNNQVVHLSAAGVELSRTGGFSAPWSVSANLVDGSCWATDVAHSQVVHLSSSGVELWRSAASPACEFFNPRSVSVDPTDGSCWVADTGNSQVAHLVIAGGPSAAFIATPTSGSAPLTVSFTDQSTGAPTAWLWHFGDGGSSAAQNPTHEYTQLGAYSVSLTVHNASGSNTKTKADCVVVTFLDVPADDWALHQILACVDAGIVKGYADGTYQPGKAVTRDQMAVYIARALADSDENVPTGPATPSFPDDVPIGSWAYKYIEYAVAQGVVQGYDPTHYQPDLVVDRGQMAVFIARAKGWVMLSDALNTAPQLFPDVPAGFWSGVAIKACVDHGVVNGYEDGTYQPQRQVTRDQMAVYVARAFELSL
jgi:PKD repeat protein